jgi:hypothetical protein
MEVEEINQIDEDDNKNKAYDPNIEDSLEGIL